MELVAEVIDSPRLPSKDEAWRDLLDAIDNLWEARSDWIKPGGKKEVVSALRQVDLCGSIFRQVVWQDGGWKENE
jgi:hypothetical protein